MWVDHVLRGIVQCPCVSVADARWIMSPFPLAPILIYECRKWESIHYPFPATSLSIFHQSPCFAPIVAGSNHKTNSSTHLLHSRPHATGLPVRQSSAQATLATTPNLLISTAIATFQYIHTHKMPIQWHWTRLSNFQIKQVLPHSKLAVLVRQIELNAENHLGQEHEHESMGHMLMENNDDDDDNGTLDFHFNCAKRDIDWYSAATTNEPHWFLPTAWAMVWLE